VLELGSWRDANTIDGDQGRRSGDARDGWWGREPPDLLRSRVLTRTTRIRSDGDAKSVGEKE
jgi:hypothetical protein